MFPSNCKKSKYQKTLKNSDCCKLVYNTSNVCIHSTRNQATIMYENYIRQRGKDKPNNAHFSDRSVKRNMSTKPVIKKLIAIFKKSKMFKFQLRSGFLLYKEEDGKLYWRTWYPSRFYRWNLDNQDRGGYVTITSKADLDQAIINIQNTDPIASIRKPDTKWIVPASPILEFALHFYPLSRHIFRGKVILPKNYDGYWGIKFLNVKFNMCFLALSCTVF